MTIFICNGFPSSGKTAFENYIKEILGDRCRIISTIDYVKECATKYFGWNGEKTPKSRKMLSDLKHLMVEYNNIPFKIIKDDLDWYALTQRLDNHTDKNSVAFVDSREPAEIDQFKTELGAKTIFIDRQTAENGILSNSSDANVKNYVYDYYIDNNGTLGDLQLAADKFIRNFVNFDEIKNS